ncbi:transactivator protein [Yamadazyma tenuis]|uniref:Uncharacterized protein n=1 Tax=Candida tenuis (strain ATCC 10573 / BCRC 21748 / CBS 615 / JCM 9827 / NBRC 10315 / NRRL Y-1498 / VKM Y-70) TaxID=590646 RepID=G3B3I2_CANTC|nr:uncharacterized protein CANTEDRAFT_114217 [Yamadazyma tenuis ATCC 10573]EGV64167.1 hypothetical protein CANTEDRAFT_114217 [Yamadazyma tenuis ATCC 10573]WEJ96183.1 transactivator protein [Yamadazyma tenuis]
MSQGLNLKRYQSFHFHPNPQDLHKPNFIFSSDVLDKAKRLFQIYSHLRTNNSQPSIDLAEHSEIDFVVNVELNTLISRNKSLKPSDLIRDNLIFLAKTNHDEVRPTNLISTLLTYDSKSNISCRDFVSDEVFIVTLSLRLLNFMVDSSGDLTIDFLKDENYGILLLCDFNFIQQIELYISRLFREVWTSSRDFDIDFSPQLADLSEINDEISGTETTLDMSDHDVTPGCCTIDDGDISYQSLHLDEDDAVTLVGKHNGQKSNINFGYLLAKNPLQRVNNKDKRDQDTFIRDIDNLRHNDSTKMQLLDTLGDAPKLGPPMRDPQYEIITTSTVATSPMLSADSLKAPNLPASNRSRSNSAAISSNFPAVKLKPSNSALSASQAPQPLVLPDEDGGTLTRRSSHNITSKQPLKKQTSFTIDLHEYDNLAPGAAYVKGVKGDKKFQFIKVGKVQKFVNLFEERVNEENQSQSTTPRTMSPRPSRPVSPTKMY